MGRKRGRGRTVRKGQGSSNVRKTKPAITGKLHVSRPVSATVETAEGVFAVAKGGVREGMNGDVVGVSLVRRGPGEPQAWVQSVIERATTTFLGRFELAGPLGAVVPLDARIARDFFVLPDDSSPRRLGVGDNDVVAARILSYPTRHEAGVVTIDRRVGSSDELDLNVEGVIASYGLATEFSERVLDEADGIRLDVERELSQDASRRDLRDWLCVTVDPVDARDFDDAVCARRLDDGGFEVGVHIADVSHYVRWGGSIDLEARERTCSTYLVDRVLPMLPERLCNDVCSLRPGEDRLCMSVVMRLSEKGEVVSADAFRSVIRSKARLDYDTVDDLLAGRVGADALVLGKPAGDVGGDGLEGVTADDVAAMLVTLDEVSRLRQRVRDRRGAIDFDTAETKVTLDENGRPTGVRVRTKTPATSLIEEAMLIANESVATMLADVDAPSAYRVHESPSPDTLAQVVPILRELGFAKGDQGERVIAGVPSAIRAVLADAEGTDDEYLVSNLLLRSMKRAIYLPTNQGHYALGARAYCHFTSPIRRYPDVITHRALKALIDGERGNAGQSPASRAVGGISSARVASEQAKLLPQLCATCSECERTADAAAWASQRVKLAELYLDHVGESFSGIVSGVERYGVFVRLDDTGAEGLLPVRALGEEWFSFDEDRMTLTGEASGTRWRLGTRIEVTVVGCTPARGQIDFALAEGSRS